MSARDTENVPLPPREREHRRSQTAPGVHHRESSAAAGATKNPQIPLPPPDGHNHHTMSTSVASCRCRNVKPVPSARAHKHTRTHTHIHAGTQRQTRPTTGDHLALAFKRQKATRPLASASVCGERVCACNSKPTRTCAHTPRTHRQRATGKESLCSRWCGSVGETAPAVR